ncbi:MAG TPA: hypothetical protein VIH05_05050, partial [Tepidiformaceae bacterium]
SAYSDCPSDGWGMVGGNPICLNFTPAFPLALGRRVVIEFPRPDLSRERFEYFVPPETTSFRPPHPDDLYRPLRVCDYGGGVMFESFVITAEGELPGGGGAANLECYNQR